MTYADAVGSDLLSTRVLLLGNKIYSGKQALVKELCYSEPSQTTPKRDDFYYENISEYSNSSEYNNVSEYKNISE